VGTNNLVRNFVVMIHHVLDVKKNALDREFVVMNSSVLTNVISNVLSVNNQPIKCCLVDILQL